MVKTLKKGDVVWRFDGKPKKYTVGHADDDTRCATLVGADGHKVWLADYSYLWRTEMKCLRDLRKQAKRELNAASKEYLKIEMLLCQAVKRGAK